MKGFKFTNGWRGMLRPYASVRCLTVLNFYAGQGICGVVFLNFGLEYTSPNFWYAPRLAEAIACTDEANLKNIENTMFSSKGVSE